MAAPIKTLAIAFVIVGTASAQEASAPYKDPKVPVDQRVSDLLGRMTLEEKVDQLSGGRPLEMGVIDPTGQFNEANLSAAMEELHRASSSFTARDRAVLLNGIQRYRLERTRLGIPAMFFGEALHGFMAKGATSFPQCLGLASTFDPELIHEVFTAAADEMASSGVTQAFTPVLDLARDPRWGRTEETYGEDPYLVSRMGVAAIQGLQGEGFPIDRHHVMATMKHFAAHGQPESGTNTAPANYSERVLRETFLVPFRAAVQEGKVGSVMASYNEIDGIPSHVNHWLLDKVLRGEWGFDGYVTSDGGGLQMLVETHKVAADFPDAARKALAAGVDFDLSDGSVYRTLVAEAKSGKVDQGQIDRAVARLLKAKFRLGLFENPFVDPAYAARITGGVEHQRLALKAAREAIVLLKNDAGLLPLDLKKLKTIAVIGPNAIDVHLGGYSREAAHGVSLLEGIKARVGASQTVLYAEGCKITEGKQGWAGWYEDRTQAADPRDQEGSLRAAVQTALKADVAIVVVGETESTNREAWSESHLGDRDSLDLLGAQDELVRRVVETGTPTVVFLINGRPLSINYAAQHVQAILEGFYLGQEGGTAAAEVLFGDTNPGGKLPLTFPRSVGQLPDFYNFKPSRNRSYIFTNREPLFAFGRGLSYTTFKFENPRIDQAEIAPGQTATLSVDITNTGSREGDEVAQLYVHQRVASVTRPVKQLIGFRRVHLKPAEKVTVDLKVTPEALSLLGEGMTPTLEPGAFDLMVGPSSDQTVPLTLIVAKK